MTIDEIKSFLDDHEEDTVVLFGKSEGANNAHIKGSVKYPTLNDLVRYLRITISNSIHDSIFEKIGNLHK